MENSINSIKELLPDVNPELFARPNMVATGIGYKKVQGKKTGEICIVCSVETKVSKAALTEKELIPPVIQGIPTDVQPSGLVHSLGLPTGRYRPAPGGVSIGHVHITTGTLGCLVARNGTKYILSNNHVLANSNQAKKGDIILQPGPYDGGIIPDDQIATLSEFITIHFENEINSCRLANAFKGIFNFFAKISGSSVRLFSKKINQTSNLVDCAIAKPLNEGDLINEILRVGSITGSAEGILDMKVKKSGRTTGLTKGVIEQVNATVRVNFGAGKTALFTDQLIAGSMSQGGDSGSIVLNGKNEVVGLLFAGSTNTTIINRIQNVFGELGVTLV